MRADEEGLDAGLRRITNREFRSNTYLLAAPGQTAPGSDCVVIDPGLDRELIEQELRACAWRPLAVLCTHGHFDHLGGAAWLQQAYRLPVHMLAADLKLAKLSNFLMAAFHLKQRISLPEFELLDGDGVAVECAGRRFAFHAIAGHTPGSAGILVDGMLFSGDSLYARKTALSKLPGEDHALLRVSLQRLFAWIDGSVRVLPGHGASATIDEIHAGNLELRAFMAAAQPA